MKNTILVTLPFSYKGKTFSPSATIDLDTYPNNKAPEPDFIYQLVAQENNIDRYSYEYEVLQSTRPEFSHASGIAKKYLTDGQFDFEAFRQHLANHSNMKALQKIAKQTLDIEDLDQHKKIKQALLEAFHAGQQR